MFDVPHLVVDAHDAVRHILGGVQVAHPACGLFLPQLQKIFFPVEAGTVFRGPVLGTGRTPSLHKDAGGSSKLLVGLDKAHVLAALPLGQLGHRVGLTPLLVQLRAAQAGALPALFPAPCIDFLVVAAQQHLRHGAAFPHLGAGVLGILQQAVPVAFFLVPLLLSQHAGLQAQHTVRHHKAGQLAAGEDVVTDGDLFIRKSIDHTLVDALIVAAYQCQVIVLGQPLCVFLGVALAACRQEHNMRGRTAL